MRCREGSRVGDRGSQAEERAFRGKNWGQGLEGQRGSKAKVLNSMLRSLILFCRFYSDFNGITDCSALDRGEELYLGRFLL